MYDVENCSANLEGEGGGGGRGSNLRCRIERKSIKGGRGGEGKEKIKSYVWYTLLLRPSAV